MGYIMERDIATCFLLNSDAVSEKRKGVVLGNGANSSGGCFCFTQTEECEKKSKIKSCVNRSLRCQGRETLRWIVIL